MATDKVESGGFGGCMVQGQATGNNAHIKEDVLHAGLEGVTLAQALYVMFPTNLELRNTRSLSLFS